MSQIAITGTASAPGGRTVSPLVQSAGERIALRIHRIVILLAFVMILIGCVAIAEIDLSGMTFDELVVLKDKVKLCNSLQPSNIDSISVTFDVSNDDKSTVFN